MATRYFDYEPVAHEAGITDADLRRLEAQVRADFPADDMLFELHLLRACVAIRDGMATMADSGPSDTVRVHA